MDRAADWSPLARTGMHQARGEEFHFAAALIFEAPEAKEGANQALGSLNSQERSKAREHAQEKVTRLRDCHLKWFSSHSLFHGVLFAHE